MLGSKFTVQLEERLRLAFNMIRKLSRHREFQFKQKNAFLNIGVATLGLLGKKFEYKNVQTAFKELKRNISIAKKEEKRQLVLRKKFHLKKH